jgi:hypothetical protein
MYKKITNIQVGVPILKIHCSCPDWDSALNVGSRAEFKIVLKTPPPPNPDNVYIFYLGVFKHVLILQCILHGKQRSDRLSRKFSLHVGNEKLDCIPIHCLPAEIQCFFPKECLNIGQGVLKATYSI